MRKIRGYPHLVNPSDHLLSSCLIIGKEVKIQSSHRQVGYLCLLHIFLFHIFLIQINTKINVLTSFYFTEDFQKHNTNKFLLFFLLSVRIPNPPITFSSLFSNTYTNGSSAFDLCVVFKVKIFKFFLNTF